MKKGIQHVIDSFLCLLYPPTCLHCKYPKSESRHIFCDACAALLQPLSAEERCQFCFEEVAHDICSDCRSRQTVWRRIAAVWDYFGPAATLVTRLKYGGQPYLAKSIASFLVLQHSLLDWPIPDAIVPAPMPFLKRLSRGYNQMHLIAVEMGLMLNVPVIDALTRSEGDYSQAGLSYHQRQFLGSRHFFLKKNRDVADRTLLLIDDVFTTGSTLRCCAQALVAGYPKELYALTVCRASR